MGEVEQKRALFVRNCLPSNAAIKDKAVERGFTVEETNSVDEALKIIGATQSGTHVKIDLLMTGLSFAGVEFTGSEVAGLQVVKAGIEAGIPKVILQTSWVLESTGSKTNDGSSIFRATDAGEGSPDLESIAVPNGVFIISGGRALKQFLAILGEDPTK